MWRYMNRAFTVLPAILLLGVWPILGSEGDQEFYFAHIVAGKTYKTTLSFSNSDSSIRGLNVEFFDDAGQPLEVSANGVVRSRLVQNLPGFASFHISLDGAEGLRTGWAKVQTHTSVTGWETIQIFSSQGQVISQATVGSNQLVEAASLTVDLNATGKGEQNFLASHIGIAVANPSEQELRLRFVLLDEFGSYMGVKEEVAVPKEGHWAQLLKQLLPDLEDRKFHGTLRIDSAGSSFAAVAAFLNGEEFSLVPVAKSPRLPSNPTRLEKLYEVNLPGNVIDMVIDEDLNRTAVTTTTGLHLLDSQTSQLLSSIPFSFDPDDREGRLSLNPQTHMLAIISPGGDMVIVDLEIFEVTAEVKVPPLCLPPGRICNILGLEMVPRLNSVLVKRNAAKGAAFPGRLFYLVDMETLESQFITSVGGFVLSFLTANTWGDEAILFREISFIDLARWSLPAGKLIETIEPTIRLTGGFSLGNHPIAFDSSSLVSLK